ncbi:MAG: PH domain-containing protein [Oscillospiraceae bacterium]
METKKSEKRIVWVWRIRLALFCLIPAAMNGWFNETMSNIWLIFTFLWVAVFIFFYAFYFPIKYKKQSYRITSKDFFVTTGVIYTITKSIPIKNVQYVSIFSSPLERIMKVATIRAVGAGGGVSISGMSKEDTKRLSSILGESEHE